MNTHSSLGQRPTGLLDSVYVHPCALVESSDIGANTRVWAFAHVMKGATVGKDCNICGHSFVESGAVIGNHVRIKNGVNIWDRVTLEDGVFVGPGVVFTNHKTPRHEFMSGSSQWSDTLIRKGVTLGAGCILLPGIEIGEYAFIAAGAVVTRSIPAHALVKGNPGRLTDWICRCMKTRVPPTAKNIQCDDCGFNLVIKNWGSHF